MDDIVSFCIDELGMEACDERINKLEEHLKSGVATLNKVELEEVVGWYEWLLVYAGPPSSNSESEMKVHELFLRLREIRDSPKPEYWVVANPGQPIKYAYGYWTGPQNDLLCTKPNITTNEEAEKYLSPIYNSKVEAKEAFNAI